MNSEKFSLKWNDFQQTVTNSFRSLRKEEEFFDVTLVSDDEVFVKGHKLVLSACSDIFKSILKKSSATNSFIYLPGISSQNLKFIMDYIYLGEVEIYQEQLDQFLEIAQKLKVNGLTCNLQEDFKEERKLNNSNPKQVFKGDITNEQEIETFISEQFTPVSKTTSQISNVEKFNFPGLDTIELDQKIQEMIEVVVGT